jgi:hypothetical protein
MLGVDDDEITMRYLPRWARGEVEAIQKFVADGEVAYYPTLLEAKLARAEATKQLRDVAATIIQTSWKARLSCKAACFALKDASSCEALRRYLSEAPALPPLPCARQELSGDAKALLSWSESLLSAAGVQWKRHPAPKCFSPGDPFFCCSRR